MGRKRKKNPVPKIPYHSPVQFQVEEEAQRLIEEALQFFDPSQKGELLPPPPQNKPRLEVSRPAVVDLHGMTVDEATKALDRRCQKLLATGHAVKIRVITGRGLHSPQLGGILTREIYAHARYQYADFIVTIDPSPLDTAIDGIPKRGHFDMILRKPR